MAASTNRGGSAHFCDIWYHDQTTATAAGPQSSSAKHQQGRNEQFLLGLTTARRLSGSTREAVCQICLGSTSCPRAMLQCQCLLLTCLQALQRVHFSSSSKEVRSSHNSCRAHISCGQTNIRMMDIVMAWRSFAQGGSTCATDCSKAARMLGKAQRTVQPLVGFAEPQSNEASTLLQILALRYAMFMTCFAWCTSITLIKASRIIAYACLSMQNFRNTTCMQVSSSNLPSVNIADRQAAESAMHCFACLRRMLW